MTQDIIKIKNGKGDKPRKGVNYQKFRENYDLIFKKNTSNDAPKKPK
jgi:hypothetical protein